MYATGKTGASRERSVSYRKPRKTDKCRMKMKNLSRKQKIKSELDKIKQFKQRVKQKMTPDRLRTFKGFEKVSDEVAVGIIESLRELSSIVLKQLNRKRI